MGIAVASPEGPDAALATGEAPAGIPWRVLWTRSNFEQKVHDHLVAKGFASFLPKIKAWARHGPGRRVLEVPMFSGYLFLRHALDKMAYIEVRKTPGLVALLGESWDRLAEVSPREIEAIRRTSASPLPVLPHPYLREGQRVFIRRGPLAGVEGLLLRSSLDKGLLVLSIHLLQRSVAVEVDCTDVDPVPSRAPLPDPRGSRGVH